MVSVGANPTKPLLLGTVLYILAFPMAKQLLGSMANRGRPAPRISSMHKESLTERCPSIRVVAVGPHLVVAAPQRNGAQWRYEMFGYNAAK